MARGVMQIARGSSTAYRFRGARQSWRSDDGEVARGVAPRAGHTAGDASFTAANWGRCGTGSRVILGPQRA